MEEWNGESGMEQGMEREKPESLKLGTKNAGIFKIIISLLVSN